MGGGQIIPTTQLCSNAKKTMETQLNGGHNLPPKQLFSIAFFCLFTELEDMCKTVGGPSANQPCIFPFKWSGKTYNSCPVDPDDSNETWCSTKTDSDGNHITGQGLWGQCGPKCKKEV